MSRYVVRLRVGDDEESLWGVYDTANRAYVCSHTREALACIVADRLNRAYEARLARVLVRQAS